MHRVIYLLFFLSGFTSLVFEVIWERSLMQVFGTTSLAISTLLTAFMSGLAIGSAIGGRLAKRLKRPLLVYGLLEGSIGLYALLIPWFLDALPWVYSQLFDHFIDDFIVFSLLRFAAVFVVLVIPTTMMGATLPIISQWTAQRERRIEGSVGLLYAMNTLGACTGALLAGFAFLPTFGLSTTNTAFAASNFVLFGLVLLFRKVYRPISEKTDTQADEDLDAQLRGDTTTVPLPVWGATMIIAGFALAGCVSMTYQVLWTRAYVIVLGSSTYSFTVVLTTFLLAISLGAATASALVHRISRPAFWLAITQLGFAIAACMTYFVLDDLPEWLFWRLREDIRGASEIYLYQFGLVAAVVFVPIFLQGMAFPLVVRAISGTRNDVGRDVGRAYALNTIGAIAGSFLAGFVVMPLVGLHTGLTIAMGTNILLACTFAVVAVKQGGLGRRRIAALAGLCLIAFSIAASAPSIDRVKLTRGMFRTYWARELFDPQKLKNDSPELLFYSDGLLATTSVEKRGGLVTLKSNGKPEASDGADMSTQILVALMPFLVRSLDTDLDVGGEDCAMVGFGSGVTAGAALQWPLKELDVVEIESTMLDASHFFDHVNHRPLEDSRTRVVESDGRNFLEYTPDTYDIIVSEPSNPWIAGVASLFTTEHFERARRKLAPGGVFSQWVQLYEIRPENVQIILATFLDVFPHVVAFSSMPKGTDLILIGSNSPITFPTGGFERAWENPTIRAELERAGIESPMEIYGLMFMNTNELAEFAAGAPVRNTDDNGYLEFQAPKDLIRYDVGEKYFQERYFKNDAYGDIRPHLQGWPAAWTDNDLAELAHAEWVSGKAALARTMLKERGLESPTTPPSPEFDSLDKMQLALHAESLELDQAAIHLWPHPKSNLHAMAIDAARGDKHFQVSNYLESQERPPRGGYSGEKGLLYAWVLARQRYYRHALLQIEGLEKRNDPIVETALFDLVAGFVRKKRRRYDAAFENYLSAGIRLLEEP